MSPYLEIEKKFLQSVHYDDSVFLREVLLNKIVAAHPEITAEQESNIRYYFKEVSTLAGIERWSDCGAKRPL
jgi:hypothetical protein